ncbi:hypothetical protein MIZ03_4594 [Rhodoferax lithotrophicus]|uniref:Uncharacterized protein n=1 Tax=Rhodoferax lithotrophicus TaxID=2798804 RepID=A0ABM7MTY9_9BURK|nr:hypothetical protein MIZ03_4594 [Rhodoferax sp. MIZ03]
MVAVGAEKAANTASSSAPTETRPCYVRRTGQTQGKRKLATGAAD